MAPTIRAIVTVPEHQTGVLIHAVLALGCTIAIEPNATDPAAIFPGIDKANEPRTKRTHHKAHKRSGWTKARRIEHGKQVSARFAAKRAEKEKAYRAAKKKKAAKE